MSELSSNRAERTIRRIHIGPLQIGIILLTLITAAIHLYRALSMSLLRGPGPGAGGGGGRRPGGPGGPGGPGRGGPGAGPIPGIFGLLTPLFYLNALGYVVLLIALYLPALGRFHRIVRWLLIAFALVTIIAWFVITGARPNALGYTDKPVEVLLIILLIVEDIQEARLRRV